MQLRLATWNIGGARIEPSPGAGFTDERLAYFVEELARLDADVVCLQEAHAPRTGGEGQAHALAAHLGLECCCHPCDQERSSHLDPTQLLCVAVLSRLPLQSSHYERLPNPELRADATDGTQLVSHDKGFITARMDPLDLYTGHMLPFGLFNRDLTEPEFADIRNALEHTVLESARPCILAGDLNHSPPEDFLPRLFAAGFHPAYSGVASEPIRGQQIDHILVSREIDVRRTGVLPGRADHYLCWADLEIR